MSAGFIYVLINPSMPGIVKIGKTTRDPSERVRELSSATGVPNPFVLIYSQPVNNCDAAERWIHDQLESCGKRLNSNREFFQAEPHEVTALVLESGRINLPSAEDGYKIQDPDTTNYERIADELIQLSTEYITGSLNSLRDPEKGIKLLEQAVDFGSYSAAKIAATYLTQGVWDINTDKQILKEDKQRAFNILKKGLLLDSGYILLPDLAELFVSEGQLKDAETCYVEFFNILEPHLESLTSEAVKEFTKISSTYLMRVICEEFSGQIGKDYFSPIFDEIREFASQEGIKFSIPIRQKWAFKKLAESLQ